MPNDPRIDQLKDLAELLQKLKKDQDKGKVGVSDVLDTDLLDAGVYAYNDGSTIQMVEFKSSKDTLELAHALKEKNLPAPVKLTNQQVQAARNLIKFHKDNGGFSMKAEEIAEYQKSTKLGTVPVELRAAASASAEFTACWSGIAAKVSLEVGASVTFGKEGGFTFTPAVKAAASASAKLGFSGLSAKAEASAEASAELKLGKLAIGDTGYSLTFYINCKGFVTAKAEFTAGFTGAKAGAFAGFGVQGEVGVQVLGKYGTGALGLKERALAIIAGVFEVKGGVGAEVEALYTSDDAVIDGSDYTKHEISVSLTFLVGASLKFQVYLLKELETAFKDKVVKAVTDKVKALVGEELYTYWTDKYDKFKSEIVSGLSGTWSSISARASELIGNGDKYSTIHNRLKGYQQKLETAISEAVDDGSQGKKAKMNEVRLKLVDYMDKHDDLPARLRKDLGTINQTLSTISTAKDIAAAVMENLEKIQEIIKISEDLIEVKISFIEATRELGATLNEKKANELITEMLDLQDEIRGDIDAIIGLLKIVIMEFKQ